MSQDLVKKVKMVTDFMIKRLPDKFFEVAFCKKIQLVEQSHKLIKNSSKEILHYIDVEKNMCNTRGFMHEGAVVLLIDLTTATVSAAESSSFLRAIEMKANYFSPIESGKRIYVLTRIENLSKDLSHCSAEIYDENAKLLADCCGVLAVTTPMKIKPKF